MQCIDERGRFVIMLNQNDNAIPRWWRVMVELYQILCVLANAIPIATFALVTWQGWNIAKEYQAIHSTGRFENLSEWVFNILFLLLVGVAIYCIVKLLKSSVYSVYHFKNKRLSRIWEEAKVVRKRLDKERLYGIKYVIKAQGVTVADALKNKNRNSLRKALRCKMIREVKEGRGDNIIVYVIPYYKKAL
jgi:hypothetical protein